LLLIEDAAEAHGAEIAGRRVGGLGRIATFSFYANKIITTGEGGMLTTDDARWPRAAACCATTPCRPIAATGTTRSVSTTG
jgi:dTDP-4-amino-4,6-dideoxygalactose transaminase